ncbi:MAG: hypothetical protein IJ775_07410 [Muribaculaceae bacterium]|nr:hypothetical protein [Muribaculaceae bacterium]
MKKLFLIIALMLLPVVCNAQNADSALNQYLEKANSLCPIVFSDGWTVDSFACEGDTITASITVAGGAASYLPMMAANAERMKKMWIGQMPQYGERWNRLVELVVAEGKSLLVLLQTEDKATSATFVFNPEELTVKP